MHGVTLSLRRRRLPTLEISTPSSAHAKPQSATIAIRRLTLFHPEASSRGIKRLQAFIEVQEDGFLLVMENSVEHFPHGEQGWESATLAAIRDICELHGLDPDPSN